MTPDELSKMLVPGAAKLDPFPHFIGDSALPDYLAESLLSWMENYASWRLHTASFFQQYELDLTATSVPEDCRIVFSPETLSSLATRYGSLFDRRMTERACVTAHKLVQGQTIGIHTDEPRGDRETHRLLVQLNRGWCDSYGGELLLLGGGTIDALHSVVAPHHNRAVGFEMSDHSFHAVAKVRGWTRYTLIFSFWAKDRLSPAMRQHVVMPQREKVLAFLNDYGATTALHSGGNFLDHLKGVERILDRWGAPLDIRLAGLMHSIYGTEGFPAISEVDRPQVEALLGEGPANLVSLFCAMDPQSLVESIVGGRPALRARSRAPLKATQDQIDALLLIHLANTAEQLPRLRHLQDVIVDDRVMYQRVRPYVLPAARAELDSLFTGLLPENRDWDTESAIEALRMFISESGGDDVLCGKMTLLGALSAMEAWLAAKKSGPELRIAALAYGLYGWKAGLSEQNRAIVRVVAGDAAERLAWLFANVDDASLESARAAFGMTSTPDIIRLELSNVTGWTEMVTQREVESLSMLSEAAGATA